MTQTTCAACHQPSDHPIDDACLAVAERAVRALPADWRDLEQLLPPPLGVWGDGTPRSTGGHPAPMNLHIDAMQRTIWWVTTTWEDVIRDRARLSDRPTSGVRDGPAIVRACTVLAPRLAMLAAVPDLEFAEYPLADPDETRRHGGMSFVVLPGWRGVLDLMRLHRQATAALGLTSPVRQIPGDCSACGRPGLRQDQPRYRGDEPPVYCEGCATTWTYAEYERYVGLWEAAA